MFYLLLIIILIKKNIGTESLIATNEILQRKQIPFETEAELDNAYEFEFQNKPYLFLIFSREKTSPLVIVLNFFSADYKCLKEGWEPFFNSLKKENENDFMFFFVEISEFADSDLSFTKVGSTEQVFFRTTKSRMKQPFNGEQLRDSFRKAFSIRKNSTDSSEKIFVYSSLKLKPLDYLKNKIDLVVKKIQRTDFFTSGESYYYGVLIDFWFFQLIFNGSDISVEFPFVFLHYMKIMKAEIANLGEKLVLEGVSKTEHEEFAFNKVNSLLSYTIDDITVSFDMESQESFAPRYLLGEQVCELKKVPVEKLEQLCYMEFTLINAGDKKWMLELPVFIDREISKDRLIYFSLLIRRFEEDITVEEELYELTFDLSNTHSKETVDFKGKSVTFTLSKKLYEGELYFNLEDFNEDLSDMDSLFEIGFEGNIFHVDAFRKEQSYVYPVEAFNGVLLTKTQKKLRQKSVMNKNATKKTETYIKKKRFFFFLIILFLIILLFALFLLIKMWKSQLSNH